MNDTKTSAILSFVSGFVDTVGFIGLGGIFTAHVTGNFVLAGASLARHADEGVVVKLLTFPLFAATVALTFAASRRLDEHGGRSLVALLLAESALIAAFAAGGAWLLPEGARDAAQTLVFAVAAPGVIAMGVQNALMKLCLPKLTMTTVMTGNVTQFAIDLARHAVAPETRAETAPRLKTVGAVIASFLVGAVAGAALYVALGFHALWIAALLVAVVAVSRRG